MSTPKNQVCGTLNGLRTFIVNKMLRVLCSRTAESLEDGLLLQGCHGVVRLMELRRTQAKNPNHVSVFCHLLIASRCVLGVQHV